LKTADGGELLNSVVAFIRRFVSLSESQLSAVALWVAHTHAIEAAQVTPYLNISSAEKQCGKTRLLEVLNLLVASPWMTGRASAAVLVRKIDAQSPTLLLDESDAAFKGDLQYTETLRGVLNSGHSRGGKVSLCVGKGKEIEFRDFHVFCPKAIAGIGGLPDTVADRSIPIRMKRRAPGEPVERFRARLVSRDAVDIQRQLGEWAARNVKQLPDAEPRLPEMLSDRQQDGVEPLLGIADVAGEEWPERGRKALLEILRGEAAEDDSIGVRLLRDIHSVFDAPEKMSTTDLLAALCDTNPEWLEFAHGKPLSAANLARLLKRYEIRPRTIRLADVTTKGYDRDWFNDAWARYLPREASQASQSSIDAGSTQFSETSQGVDVTRLKSHESPANTRFVTGVTAQGGGVADQGDYLFDAAVSHCREIGYASVSDLVTALGVSPAEAVRYIDKMERLGLVPAAKGGGPRPFAPPTAADLGFS
jgi:hypothetical protein